jgi:hypothetical protein
MVPPAEELPDAALADNAQNCCIFVENFWARQGNRGGTAAKAGCDVEDTGQDSRHSHAGGRVQWLARFYALACDERCRMAVMLRTML